MTYVPEQISSFRASNEEISKLCGYIKDDRFIANYLGEKAHWIKAIRDAMPAHKPSSNTFDSNTDYLGNAQRTADEAAVTASSALLRSLVRYGLNHDGLPGMPAARLLSMAAEMGISA